MRNCLITGGAGYMGSRLARELIGRGCRVVVLDDLSGPRSKKPPGVDMVQADVCEPGPIREQIAYFHPEVVFHLAGKESPESQKCPIEYLDINAMGALNVLKACLGAGVRRVVLASTGSVYGLMAARGGSLFSGRSASVSAPAPAIACAASKLIMEEIGRFFDVGYEMPVVSLRYHSIYGPSQPRGSGIISRLVAAAKTKRPLNLKGISSSSVYHWTHVRDAVALTAEAGLAGSRQLLHCYDIAGPEPSSVADLIQIASELSGRQMIVKTCKSSPRLDCSVDTSEADRDLGAASTGLRAGLSSCLT